MPSDSPTRKSSSLDRHVAVCSRANPPPSGKCSLCDGPYDHSKRRTIGVPACGHFMHEQCLVTEFRTRDGSIGRCPICNLVLCERDLADCIKTDRVAIFGTQFTKLHTEVRVEFPHRGEVARLQSEEEVAAAKLRLVKEYIDVHADEFWQQCQMKRGEPNWYAEIIQPVISLFKGWNSPIQQSQYFADRDAFLKLIAWAELVRLMNVTHVASPKCPDQAAAFPPLAELHRKFLCAKGRYDKEKKTWKTNRCGVLQCEKVAQDAYNVAMSTHVETC